MKNALKAILRFAGVAGLILLLLGLLWHFWLHPQMQKEVDEKVQAAVQGVKCEAKCPPEKPVAALPAKPVKKPAQVALTKPAPRPPTSQRSVTTTTQPVATTLAAVTTTTVAQIRQDVRENPTIARLEAPPPQAGQCREWVLMAYAWGMDSPKMSGELRSEVLKKISEAKTRDSRNGENLAAYTGGLSATLGGRLLSELQEPAAVSADIQLRYVDRDPQTSRLTRSKAGTIKLVNGKGAYTFFEDPRVHEAVEMIWPSGGFVSPEESGPLGDLARRLLVKKDDWPRDCRGIFASGVVPASAAK
jgi:hypothetical protein